MADRVLRVLIETTPKKVFVSALDWPGLARPGRDEAAAVETLLAYVERYTPVARAAGMLLPGIDLRVEVVQRVEGDSSTAYGVPSRVADVDREPVTADDAHRLAALVGAAWERFDHVSASAPEALRKGPRGGGRDTSKIIEHVTGADEGYAAVLGIPPAERRPAARLRVAELDLLRLPSDGSPIAGRKWPARYAARRIAWHALDHAWEIEDRSHPG